eukprot:1093639-Karenia_brevis.AAC.1
MIRNWKSKGEPPEPTSIHRNWVDFVTEAWGERWGQIEPVVLAATMDYFDTHYNKFEKIMGQAPPAAMSFSKVAR